MDTLPAPVPERHRRVLVVDDDDDARREFADTLRLGGYEVAEAWSVVQGMRLLLSFKPDAVVLDMILPDGDGADLGRAMRSIVTTQGTCVVAVTANPGALALIDPSSFGARTILTKPLAPETLLDAVGQCFPAFPAGLDPAAPEPRPLLGPS